jgi:hypothetical protein
MTSTGQFHQAMRSSRPMSSSEYRFFSGLAGFPPTVFPDRDQVLDFGQETGTRRRWP